MTYVSTKELLALRIQQLERREEDIQKALSILQAARISSKIQFEKKFHTRLIREAYQPGTLVLLRNSTIEKELNRKTKPRYLGPYKVLRYTKGGSYILGELDGTILARAVAAFRLIPYITRLDLTKLTEPLDKINDSDNESNASHISS